MNELKSCSVCGSPMRKCPASGNSFYYYCVHCKKLFPVDGNAKKGRIKGAVARLLLPVVRKLSKK